MFLDPQLQPKQMKKLLVTFVATALGTSLSLAQVGTPADAGLIPRTPTIDVNTNYNNSALETGDITITDNGNVFPVWEDDGGDLTDWEAVWTVYNNNGVLLTPPVTITNIPGSACFPTDPPAVPNVTYRAFFRSNGSPTPGYTGDFGGKGKGNWFGPGFAFMAGCDAIACEIPELTAIQVDGGGAGTHAAPFVQLANNDGSRNTGMGGPDVAGIVSFSDADVEAADGNGDVRPTDVEFLSNGNIVIAGFSRTIADRLLTGQTAGNVVVYKVLNSSGGVVKAYSAATSEVGPAAAGQDAWHGVAATSNGFAIRFSQAGDKMRMFDNNGNPVGPNINIAAVTGHPEAATAGRGDGMGFKSNGKDAYVYAVNSGAGGPWVTVFNADGTLRYSRAVTETNELGAYANSDRLDAAIAADGSVIVAFDASNNDTNNINLYRLPQARLFNPCGQAIGPVFYLSEREHATNAVASNANCRPRVAWRGNMVAAMWCSLNSPIAAGKILGMRLFDVGTPPPSLDPVIPCSAETLGMKRIVPDTLVWFSLSQNKTKLGGYTTQGDQAPGGSSVEATAGVLGDSTFLLAATTQATNDPANMSLTSVLIPASGGTPRLDNLFYTDAGTAWLNQINLSRQTGNPGRVGGDPRYGAVNYGGAGEVSLFAYPEFNSDGRFSNPFFDYANSIAGRSYGGQIHRLNPTTLVSTPLMKAVDAMFGRTWTNSVPPTGGQDFGRCGSAPIGLDNGNFVFVGEDRTTLNTAPGGPRAAMATIFAPNGTIVKEAFRVTPVPTSDGSMWNSVGAFKGGFFIRPASGIIYFYDNAGNLQGSLDHNAASGLNYDLGRSDGTRMCSDIRNQYVFQAGKAPESSGFTNIMLTAYNAVTRTWITNTIVSEGTQDTLNTGGTRLLDRANVACDAYNRVTVIYRVRPDRTVWLNDQVAARVFQFDGTKFTPLTPSFFPFVEHDSVGDNVAGFKQVEPSVAMTSREILFYAKGFWNADGNPTNAAVTLDNTHAYTILSHPVPIAAPQPVMTITKSGANAIIAWNADAGLFRVQKTTSLTSPSWTEVTGGVNVATPVDAGAIGATPTYFRLIR